MDYSYTVILVGYRVGCNSDLSGRHLYSTRGDVFHHLRIVGAIWVIVGRRAVLWWAILF